ncbi:putative MerR family transcriptional regulator [Anaplasma centrale str. Israel]|uniref:Putative MerR family transcriptional regulator n=1 Tax=Anaplasma centrale (strain Israel) TaxID=574556 RepID=D1AT56_ANACI|nr:MerR family transcriptional regulator [Anaplasma centrale]ACZ48734.1 putative MerR family transcriptional regulator [Anaplasma centrale str. Israel]
MTADLQTQCEADEVHERVFWTISDVAKEVGVEQYVLRFWESKFPQINPIKRRGRRLYDKHNVAAIKKIKHMLYDRGYTIRGAQLELKRRKSTPEVAAEERDGLVQLLNHMTNMRDVLLKKLNGM